MNILSRARLQRENILKATQSLDDISAAATPELFPKWRAGVDYTTGYRVEHGGALYKALVDHTSAEGYTPDITNYQWVAITDPSIEYPDWVQPLGYADAYPLGAKVTHNGKRWISTVNENTWEPGVYGWDEIS